MNMGIYEGAIGYFEQQLATLEQLSSHTSLTDKVNIFVKTLSLFIYFNKIIILINRAEHLVILVTAMMH